MPAAAPTRRAWLHTPRHPPFYVHTPSQYPPFKHPRPRASLVLCSLCSHSSCSPLARFLSPPHKQCSRTSAARSMPRERTKSCSNALACPLPPLTLPPAPCAPAGAAAAPSACTAVTPLPLHIRVHIAPPAAPVSPVSQSEQLQTQSATAAGAPTLRQVFWCGKTLTNKCLIRRYARRRERMAALEQRRGGRSAFVCSVAIAARQCPLAHTSCISQSLSRDGFRSRGAGRFLAAGERSSRGAGGWQCRMPDEEPGAGAQVHLWPGRSSSNS